VSRALHLIYTFFLTQMNYLLPQKYVGLENTISKK
jgi:hypothetical protein